MQYPETCPTRQDGKVQLLGKILQVLNDGGGGAGVDATQVVGPASATDNAVARFDGTTGKLVQNSSVTIADDGAIAGPSSTFTISAAGVGRVVQLGVGIAPITELTVASTVATTPRGFMVAQYTNDTMGARLYLRKSRGATAGTDTAITAGDTIGSIFLEAYSGAGGYVQAASIRAVNTGTVASTQVSAHLIISLGTDAAPTVLTDRVRIHNSAVSEFGLSTIANTIRLNETTDGAASPTNYSRLSLQTQASPGNILIRSEAAGTALVAGQPRILQVGTGPSVGTDIAGNSFIVHGGPSTGAGLGGKILLQTSATTGTGASVNSLVTRMDIAGSVGPSVQAVNIYSGGISLNIGADQSLATRTDATAKVARISCPHYLAAQAPFCGFFFAGNSATSEVLIGGGTSVLNAATDIYFYTAANNTTVTGTERVRITSTGLVTFAGATSSFPALKRSTTFLEFRLADDSGYTGLTAGIGANKVVEVNGTGLGFFTATPIARPTTAIAASTFVAGAGTAVNDASTFDGYTLGQITKALRDVGLLT